MLSTSSNGSIGLDVDMDTVVHFTNLKITSREDSVNEFVKDWERAIALTKEYF